MVKQTKSRLRSRSRSRLRQPKRSRRQRSQKSRQPKQSRRSRHSRSRRNSAGGTVSRSVSGGVSDFTKGVGAGVVGLTATDYAAKKSIHFIANKFYNVNVNTVWPTFWEQFCETIPFLKRDFLDNIETDLKSKEFDEILQNFKSPI